MKTRINSSEVVYSRQLLLKKTDEVWVEFTAIDWNVKVLVKMEFDHQEQGFDIQPAYSEEHGQYGILELRNWGNYQNVSFNTEFGETQGRKVQMDVAAQFIGAMCSLHLQFRVED